MGLQIALEFSVVVFGKEGRNSARASTKSSFLKNLIILEIYGKKGSRGFWKGEKRAQERQSRYVDVTFM